MKPKRPVHGENKALPIYLIYLNYYLLSLIAGDIYAEGRKQAKLTTAHAIRTSRYFPEKFFLFLKQ